MTTLYRAVPRDGFDAAKIYTRQATPRAPSNVPYVVDNLWEYLRPEVMPSRRHAVYASPTPELALQNASSAGVDRSEYVVCEVHIQGTYRMAQLAVVDARHHTDVYALPKAIIAALGRDFGLLPCALRHCVGPLFMPYLGASEMTILCDEHTLVRECVEKVCKLSSFWLTASTQANPLSSGELFFELDEHSSYVLVNLP